MAHWTSCRNRPGHDPLTPKERVALAHIIRGASSKDAGRTLGVSPRTVDFHRANLLKARRQERRRSRAQGARRISERMPFRTLAAPRLSSRKKSYPLDRPA
jgi:DNA-binding CsgD family transcriptional regulator